MGREAASSAPSALASACDHGHVRLFLDAAAHAHNPLRRAEIDRLRRSAERLAWLGANLRGIESRREDLNRRRCRARLCRKFICAKRPRLHRDKARPIAGVPIGSVQPPLHQLPREDRAVADRNHIANQHLAHTCTPAPARSRAPGKYAETPLASGALVLDEMHARREKIHPPCSAQAAGALRARPCLRLWWQPRRPASLFARR